MNLNEAALTVICELRQQMAQADDELASAQVALTLKDRRIAELEATVAGLVPSAGNAPVG